MLEGSALSRTWYRSRRGKMIAGVCAGLAEQFGTYNKFILKLD